MTRTFEVTLETELRKPLPSAGNLREHPMVRHKRVKAVRKWVEKLLLVATMFRVHWRTLASNRRLGLRCTLTRIAPRKLDSDNLQSAFKGVRDEIAKFLELNDGSPRWLWDYQQQPGPAAVRIKLEVVLDPLACTCGKPLPHGEACPFTTDPEAV